ncbi:DUF4249 domain-containing protein [Tamlana sp. 2201CG12-4]|uniref:DUF4249 domain-containing protein n=1 Tax=Tamlana sp. 2201CG12-4 TaxID=3112582 RepID=UPI002DBD3D45|nr:DUF4249 domain-containing protein [Tamlana sp. 2201CG12-4]MEC3908521.1 DUF4249 domain-containing protein [Tamlana sp. 2201CG12-4]
MKKLQHILLLGLLLITSCQDVIDVELNTTDPKLVIDASLNWIKGTSGNNQFIRLTLSAPYFDSEIPPATGATVTVTDSKNNTFNFIEDNNTGLYINNNFIPEIDGIYNLSIIYNNETYTATERLYAVVPIDFVEQKDDGGFSGEEIEIKAFYTDPPGIENFYLFEFLVTNKNTLSLEVYDDEFTDGNQIFAFYSDEDLETGDELIIRNSGISERTYQFINILLQQTDEDSGDPFETQPATVRGNCINQTNPSNFPLGYFRVTETDVFTYTVK